MNKTVIWLILTLLLAIPSSVIAMDTIATSDLDSIYGQAGITIAFGGTSKTRMSFSTVAWGDPNGVPNACANSIGWLIIKGPKGFITDEIIGDGQTLTLDVGRTGLAGCTFAADNLTLPASTTFIYVGMPTLTVSASVPSTMGIGLGATSSTISGTVNVMYMKDLTIIPGTPPRGVYLWSHP